MYKDELIQLHQFLVYVLKYLKTVENVNKEPKEYLSLNISPHHIHRTKIEHKCAIFVLSAIISKIIFENGNDILPESVVSGLQDLAEKSKKQVIEKRQNFS